MKKYKQFKIVFEPFITELVCGALWELDIDGITEEENEISVFTNENKNTNLDSIQAVLEKLQSENVISNFSIQQFEFEDKNWNEEWEKSLNVIDVSERLVIKPSFREYNAKPEQLIITIDPKMSFGTGEHQTTKLVLRMLEEEVKPGIRVLDIGTGTGILAIGAVKLGASGALGIDNDEWCFINAKENIELNNVSDKIDVKLAEINSIQPEKFDLVCANINKNILIDIAAEVYMFIADSGKLILSGLLIQDEKDITEHYSSLGLKSIKTKVLDEWISILFQKDKI